MPCILDHAQQRTLRGQPRRHRKTCQQPLALDDAGSVLGKDLGQRTIGKVHAQHITPEIALRADAGAGCQLIDPLQDKVFRLVLTPNTLQLAVMRL
ncbi:MAG: hypothetical protein BWZ07_02921 [Alphaproteobacteria bacterium ADurb.BinA280]|nr:MAG: hypothetical protein BWZ07_02921 [Alphaproteobacteria bacterium ADurb.BinA280]